MNSDQREYLRNWLFRANEDIFVIEKLFNSEPELFNSSICYHAQPAVEKFLKAFLVYNNVDFPRTHDLDFLILECKKINNSIFEVNLGSLTDFGVSIRYPDDFYLPDKDEVIYYRNISRTIKEIVEANIIL